MSSPLLPSRLFQPSSLVLFKHSLSHNNNIIIIIIIIMASDQLARRDNSPTETDILVEKDTVPKMTTHFEHLTDPHFPHNLTPLHSSIHGAQSGFNHVSLQPVTRTGTTLNSTQTDHEAACATTVITCTLEKGDNTHKPRESEKSTQHTTKNAHQAATQTVNNNAQPATQAKDSTLDKGEQGYAAISRAKECTHEAAEKASYVGEKAVTVESGKSAAGYAAKVASDLKDKAAAMGWAAAHFSTEKTVEGTKAAAHVVEGAAGYAGQKAAALASKSAGAVKGLAASAGETAKEYTARKKAEANQSSLPQEAEERPSGGRSEQEGNGGSVLTAIGETVSSVGKKVKKPFENIIGRESEGGGEEQGKGVIGQTPSSIAEKLGDAKQREELLDNITEGVGEVLGAVTETVAEIGDNMIRPAERVQEYGQAQHKGGVLGAIGETIAEIAETTKVMVAGEDDRELRHSGVSDPAKHEGSQTA
ncbi:hypothetical protein VNO78_13799 [Psophocarpus tetragonolobus]|uniref:Seed biotin-containing protein SBP65 n=1 Tax=Psophocarpus tetragonolobus TaxID=3891 RepID=A0AAN9SY23_PSOTE